jgi:hypothetical protein
MKTQLAPFLFNAYYSHTALFSGIICHLNTTLNDPYFAVRFEKTSFQIFHHFENLFGMMTE